MKEEVEEQGKLEAITHLLKPPLRSVRTQRAMPHLIWSSLNVKVQHAAAAVNHCHRCMLDGHTGMARRESLRRLST